MDERDRLYDVVAARRLQWDQLVWQVPVLSLTAQAFLFTIALGNGSSRIARIVASALSLIISFLSIELMSRHRQAEVFDAKWLEAFEKDLFSAEIEADPSSMTTFVVHGRAYRDARVKTRVGPLGRFPGYETWLTGLGLFGAAAAFVLVLAAVVPSALR